MCVWGGGGWGWAWRKMCNEDNNFINTIKSFPINGKFSNVLWIFMLLEKHKKVQPPYSTHAHVHVNPMLLVSINPFLWPSVLFLLAYFGKSGSLSPHTNVNVCTHPHTHSVYICICYASTTHNFHHWPKTHCLYAQQTYNCIYTFERKRLFKVQIFYLMLLLYKALMNLLSVPLLSMGHIIWQQYFAPLFHLGHNPIIS